MIYAYIKGARYNDYKVYFEGNEDIKEIDMTFDDLEQLQDFVIKFSDYNSISVQYYI